MAQPQDKEQMASAIDAIASRAMGVDPQQAAAPANPQQAAPPPQAQAPAPEAPVESDQGKAATQGSPDTEGDAIAAEAVIYEIDFGDMDKEGNKKKRNLTDQQIKSTFDRYSAMNYKNAQYKPVQDVIEQIAKANPGMDMQTMAREMLNIYNAQVSNPTMGNTQGDASGKDQTGAPPESLAGMLSKWEDDNAVALPPGYKDMLTTGAGEMQLVKQELAKTQRALQQVLAQSQGVADAAKNQVEKSNTDKVGAVKQQIANNLDKAQAALKLPDDKADDFMLFSAERGFTLEDFIDPNLTIKVMNDFANNMNSPEMDRMKDIASRRQAYTGSLGSTPTSGPAAAPSQTDSTFDKMSAAIMSKKGLS